MQATPKSQGQIYHLVHNTSTSIISNVSIIQHAEASWSVLEVWEERLVLKAFQLGTELLVDDLVGELLCSSPLLESLQSWLTTNVHLRIGECCGIHDEGHRTQLQAKGLSRKMVLSVIPHPGRSQRALNQSDCWD